MRQDAPPIDGTGRPWRPLRGVALLGAAGLFVYLAIPPFLLPAGVWFRRELRSEPLASPWSVTAVAASPPAIYLGHRRLGLAGITLAEPGFSEVAAVTINAACKQGVVAVRDLGQGDFLLRCEPRVVHCCGNDRVAAHYEQFVLQELLLATGYYRVAFNDRLTTGEVRRLLAAEQIGRECGNGVWGDRRVETGERGFAIGDLFGVNDGIDAVAPEVPATAADYRP